jgi:hypothetical protein
MAASIAPDLDGISMISGINSYLKYHHVLTHNLAFGVFASAMACALVKPSFRYFLILLTLFHVHLLMDLYGSGIGWGIAYFWPFSGAYLSSDHAWSFVGWQNYMAFGILAVWTIVIARKLRRTPLEWVAPRLNAEVLGIREKAAEPVPTENAGK